MHTLLPIRHRYPVTSCFGEWWKGIILDFDSKRGEKEAATLANKGVAAFIWFQKYVGEYLI
ncbi:MAG: hypothetical protein ACYDDN_07520, partial [Candidatus Desulforudaceae bacterium]